MGRIGIVFESQYGHTKKVAERVAQRAAEAGYEVRLVQVAEAAASDIEGSDAVVLLAPVYDRQHAEALTAFAKEHRVRLAARPTAFFSVSLAAAIKNDVVVRESTGKLVREFLDATGLLPTTIAKVAGALDYPAYPSTFRRTMRAASLVLRLPTDTSRAHDLTDWAAVDRATSHFIRHLEGQTMHQVIYASWTGNTRKVADAIAGELGVTPVDVSEGSVLSGTDVLFLGTGCYGKKPSPALMKLVASSDVRGRKVALFGTSGGGESMALAYLAAALEQKGANVRGSYCCKGRTFWLLQRGHPDVLELANARRFAREMSRTGSSGSP